MLYLPDSAIDALQELIRKAEKENGDLHSIYREALLIDPTSPFALMGLTEKGRELEHRAEVEDLTWRLAEVMPWNWAPYLRLSDLYSSNLPLSKGLAELAYSKLLFDPDAMDRYNWEIPWDIPGTAGLDAYPKFQAAAQWLREQREAEPSDVADRLRPHRLFYEMQEHESLSPELVDRIIAEGEAMVPVLMGVLRSWLHDSLPADGSFVASSIALLAEIGDLSVFADLLEVPGTEEPDIDAASHWALDRMVERHPEETRRIMLEVAKTADARTRMCIGSRLLANPRVDPDGKLVEALFENFDRVDKKTRESTLSMALMANAVLHGREGIERGRSAVRRIGELLSRDDRRRVEDLLAQLSSAPLPPPPEGEPSETTVYQICAGEVEWPLHDEDPEDDAELIPEPITRVAVPGRNDPCWCASGKKYKKCHLDSDEQRARESG